MKVLISLMVFLTSGGSFAQTAIERYQTCFEKMIDAGETDNNFMKKCLGLKVAAESGQAAGSAASSVVNVSHVVDKQLPGLQACYQKFLVSTKELGFTPEGTLEVSFMVEGGSIANITFAQTSLADTNLLSCSKKWLSSLSFPKTGSSSNQAVIYAFRLSVKPPRQGQIAVVSGYPKISALDSKDSKESKNSKLSKEMLAVFRNNSYMLSQCHDDLLKHDKIAAGHVTVELSINASGQVSKVNFKELTVSDEQFKSCLTEKLKSWRFPQQHQKMTTVRYPTFYFDPK